MQHYVTCIRSESLVVLPVTYAHSSVLFFASFSSFPRLFSFSSFECLFHDFRDVSRGLPVLFGLGGQEIDMHCEALRISSVLSPTSVSLNLCLLNLHPCHHALHCSHSFSEVVVIDMFSCLRALIISTLTATAGSPLSLVHLLCMFPFDISFRSK